MKIEGYSYDVFKQMSPQKIRLYLISCGWKHDGKISTYDYFSNPRTGYVVTVPNSREYSDYAYRVEEVIRTVSDSDDIPVQRVLSGMTVSSLSDTIEYHYEPENGEMGLIPIPDMQVILSSASDLNNYAYRDLCEFRPYYASSSWKGRKDLDCIRMGPTIPGSYTIQFICPLVSGDSSQMDLDGKLAPDNPKMSALCDKIESSLGCIIDAAENNRTELEDGSDVSYNFISSVMDLSFDKADVEIRRIRMMRDEGVPRPYALSSSLFPKISVIETNMRPREMTVEQDFIGRITLVKDPRNEPNDEPADVTITFIDPSGRMRNATFQLSGEELNLAYDASKSRRNVQVSGALVGGRHKRIEDVKGFKILD